MDTLSWLIAIGAALIIGVAVTWILIWNLQGRRLRRRFGPEYDRALKETGSRRRTEEELERRQARVQSMNIVPLSSEQRLRFLEDWRIVQARFADKPSAAVADAHRLVERVMEARGYPISDFDQQAADLSVDHPQVVEHYRVARALAHRDERGDATTEDLRQAMVHYRTLFQDLLEEDINHHAETRS